MDRGEQLRASGAQVVTPEAARELISSHFDVSPYEQIEAMRQTGHRKAIAEGADYIDLEDDVAGSIPRFGNTKRIVSLHNFRRLLDHRRVIGDARQNRGAPVHGDALVL